MTPAIVLAAGTSSRYAAGNKLLAGIGGLPLLVHVIATLRPATRPIVIVTGYQAARVRSALRQGLGHTSGHVFGHVSGHVSGLRFVHNRHYRDGMAGSLKLGVRALPPWASKAFLCLGDMPDVDARLLRRLRAGWRPDLDVIRPMCRGRPGHPVLISARLFTAFDTLTGDRGAKLVLATVPAARQQCVAWHAGCIIDTDTPGALRRAALRGKRRGARSSSGAEIRSEHGGTAQ